MKLSKYKHDNKRVETYMNNVIAQINSDYTTIPDAWSVTLDLLSDTLVVYFKSTDDISKNGIVHYDKNGIAHANPAVRIQNVALQNISKLMGVFGLNPLAKSKIKHNESDDYETVLNNLIGA